MADTRERRTALRHWLRIAVVTGLVLLLVAATAAAQGTGRILDLDLSIRSSGMGGASNAVFWGGDPNQWANPALLGYHRGLTYTWGKTQLVPGLATDVFLESKRYTLGLVGVGLELAGNGPGEIRLEYGASQGTDPSGNFTGTFASFEEVGAWGFGVSLSEALAGWAALRGRPVPAAARYADIAFGFASKDLDMQLALLPASARGTATGKDYGVLLRASPLVPGAGAALPIHADLAYGYSVLNYNDAHVTFITEDQATPLTRMNRNGVGARIALGVPSNLRDGASPALRWLLDSIDPMISFGAAKDWEHNSAGGVANFFDVDRFGVEVVLANVFNWRIGHVTDRLGDIDGDTRGWGVGFRIGRLAGLRYDRATIPQAKDSGLDDVERKGYTAFVDLIALLPHDHTERF